jgi:hypothetical protein
LVLVDGAFFFVAYNILTFNDSCENEVLSELPSPDGQIKAVIFQRDYVVTLGYNTQFSVLETDEELKKMEVMYLFQTPITAKLLVM